MKLYPPILEGTIPAFYFDNEIRYDEEANFDKPLMKRRITAIKVPYEMNRGVSNADFDQMELKIKMVQSTSNKWQTIRSYKVDKINKIAYFDISDLSVEITRFINIGQFYKIQMAYVSITPKEGNPNEPEKEVGYFSTVATVKYTARPRVTIANLNNSDVNSHLYSYVGLYNQSKKEYAIIEEYLDSPGVASIIETGEKSIQSIADGATSNNGSSSEEIQTFKMIRSAVNNNNSNSNNINENIDYEAQRESSIKGQNNLSISKFAATAWDSIQNILNNENITNATEVVGKIFNEIGNVAEQIGEFLGGAVNYIINSLTDENLSEKEKEEKETSAKNEIDNYKSYMSNYIGYSSLNIPFTPSYGGDSSEKVYSYKFDLYDRNSNLIESTGWQLHDSSTDLNIYESQDTCRFNRDLNRKEYSYIRYTVRTLNNLEVSSPKYRIIQQVIVGPVIEMEIKPTLDFENGRVKISLRGPADEYGLETITTGNYRIMRASEESNYLEWEQIADFSLYGQKPSKYLYYDYTVKQGVHYIYGIQQYNAHNISSDRIQTDKIYVDFEHAFLFDGERQLKIKYNPKVSSFKATKLESKLDTIGSKYPFILRNGNVDYKEFPISGLISYKMDEELCFIDKDFLKQEVGTTNLIGENIADERNFKLEVMKWLTDGNPKLFRSPSEGNYIIRLLNVSTTPTDSLNRMLHTFNGTAYEIAQCSFDNLVKYGLIKNSNQKTDQILWKSIELNKWGENHNTPISKTNLLDKDVKAIGIKFEGMTPGDRMYLNNGKEQYVRIQTADGEKKSGYVVTIGATGEYNIDIQNGEVFSEVLYLSAVDNPLVTDKRVHHQGTITYAYYGQPWNAFDNIKNIDMFYNPSEMFVGPYIKLDNPEIPCGLNIIDYIKDVRTSPQDIGYIRLTCKEVHTLYKKDGTSNYYSFLGDALKDDGSSISQRVDIEQDLDPWCVYKVLSTELRYAETEEKVLEYIDGYTKKVLDGYSSKVSINGDIVDLEETQEYFIDDLTEFGKEFIIGSGIICEIGYQQVTSTYAFEDELKSAAFEKVLETYNIRYNNIYNYDEDELENLSPLPEEQKYHINKNIAWQSDIEHNDSNETLLKNYEIYLKELEEKIREEMER